MSMMTVVVMAVGDGDNAIGDNVIMVVIGDDSKMVVVATDDDGGEGGW